MPRSAFLRNARGGCLLVLMIGCACACDSALATGLLIYRPGAHGDISYTRVTNARLKGLRSSIVRPQPERRKQTHSERDTPGERDTGIAIDDRSVTPRRSRNPVSTAPRNPRTDYGVHLPVNRFARHPDPARSTLTRRPVGKTVSQQHDGAVRRRLPDFTATGSRVPPPLRRTVSRQHQR